MNSSIYTYRRLLEYVKPYWPAFALAIFGNILYAGLDSFLVKLLEPLLNEGFVARDEFFIRWVPAIVIGIFVLRGSAGFLADYFMSWVGRNVVMIMRQRLFEHYLELPAQFYDHNSAGELISTITFNVEQVAEASTDAITVTVRETLTAVGLLVVMCTVSVWLTSLFILTIPVVAWLMYAASRRLRRVSGEVQQAMGSVTHVAEEAIVGFRVVKTFGGEQYERERFMQTTQKNRRQEMKLVTTAAVNVPMVQIVGAMALALIIYLSTRSHELFGQTITPGGFTAVIVAMIALLKPIKQLTKINSKIQKGIAAAQSIFEVLDEPEEIDTGTEVLQRVKGDIEFQNISFRYHDDGAHILKGISFRVNAGETIAIVGRSGGGKSTLMQLLPRFYNVNEGHILLDGIDIQSTTLKSLRQQFAFVSQNITLFNDTVRNNILYGHTGEVSETRLREIAEASHALEFIERLPQGFDTPIGDNGLRLSGGQRQRLAIARALIKDAPILIFDEATSALDSESERLIQEALERLRQNRTTFIIAHRLSTIERASRIVVIENGAISEMGTHESLLLNQGLYASLQQLLQKESAPVLAE